MMNNMKLNFNVKIMILVWLGLVPITLSYDTIKAPTNLMTSTGLNPNSLTLPSLPELARTTPLERRTSSMDPHFYKFHSTGASQESQTSSHSPDTGITKENSYRASSSTSEEMGGDESGYQFHESQASDEKSESERITKEGESGMRSEYSSSSSKSNESRYSSSYSTGGSDDSNSLFGSNGLNEIPTGRSSSKGGEFTSSFDHQNSFGGPSEVSNDQDRFIKKDQHQDRFGMKDQHQDQFSTSFGTSSDGHSQFSTSFDDNWNSKDNSINSRFDREVTGGSIPGKDTTNSLMDSKLHQNTKFNNMGSSEMFKSLDSSLSGLSSSTSFDKFHDNFKNFHTSLPTNGDHIKNLPPFSTNFKPTSISNNMDHPLSQFKDISSMKVSDTHRKVGMNNWNPTTATDTQGKIRSVTDGLTDPFSHQVSDKLGNSYHHPGTSSSFNKKRKDDVVTSASQLSTTDKLNSANSINPLMKKQGNQDNHHHHPQREPEIISDKPTGRRFLKSDEIDNRSSGKTDDKIPTHHQSEPKPLGSVSRPEGESHHTTTNTSPSSSRPVKGQHRDTPHSTERFGKESKSEEEDKDGLKSDKVDSHTTDKNTDQKEGDDSRYRFNPDESNKDHTDSNDKKGHHSQSTSDKMRNDDHNKSTKSESKHQTTQNDNNPNKSPNDQSNHNNNNQDNKSSPTDRQLVNNPSSSTLSYSYNLQDLYSEVTRIRQENGLHPLPISSELQQVASLKCDDMEHYLHNGLVSGIHDWGGTNYPCTYSNLDCMELKPQQLANYPHRGHEISRSYSGKMNVKYAIDGWLSSPGHYGVLTESGNFKEMKYMAMGACLSEHYSNVWFGIP